jgi:hypothetical protein
VGRKRTGERIPGDRRVSAVYVMFWLWVALAVLVWVLLCVGVEAKLRLISGRASRQRHYFGWLAMIMVGWGYS